MARSIYSRWDGTQDPLGPEIDVSSIVDAISEDLLGGLDPSEALARLMRRGVPGQFRGLDSIRERLRRARRDAAGQGRLDGLLEQAREELDGILEDERIELSLSEDPEARVRESFLESLPPDAAGRIAELRSYEFLSQRARERFNALMERLRQEVLGAYFRSMAGAMQNLTPEQLAAMRDMLADLNGMIEQRRRGTGPSQDEFDEFMRRHGSFFPENPRNLDELLEAMARRMAAMGQLLASLSEEQRAELMALSEQVLSDLDLQFQVSSLADSLRELFPGMPWDSPASIDGDRPLGLAEGLDAIERLGDLDAVERALRGEYAGATLEDVDLDRVRRALGEDAARDIERLRRIEKALEESGMISRRRGQVELTARGIRKLGERALASVFGRLRAERTGRHDANETGQGGEPTGASRAWRFGDSFGIDVQRTIGNAVLRTGPVRGRVAIEPGDFEIAETETRTTAATVLLLDMSFSMPMRGNWVPAKRMALALHALISTQFPGDSLDIVGFSDYARILRPEDLAKAGWEHVYGTNMEHAFNLAGRLLAKHPGADKQVLLVTDGEPTAHLEPDGTPFFRWPPVRKTLEKTYTEALRLSRAGITMNIFMLEDTPNLFKFIDSLAKVISGRVFAVHGDDLGAVVVRDYVGSRKRAG